MNDTNIDVDDNREYLERGVQTEDALNVIQLGLATMSITSAERNSEEDFVSPGHIPSDADSLPETQGAYTHPSEMDQVDPATGVQDPEDSTYPGELIDDTLRVLKRQSSKQPRLPSTRTLKSISARVVSLPETAPVYTLKTSTEYIARRVVSNPDGLQGPHLDSDDLLESYEHVHAPRSRVRVKTHGTDIPHTPSPPSSPDSVVIISNKPQLSEDFLQKNVSKDELSCDYNKANGWISWARSPPRPIPALHGPLSLPYARCPSGAEGTIIEEPDNMPRMIWGLNQDGMHTARSQVGPAQSQPTPHKVAPRSAPLPVVPPRFSKAKEQVQVISHSQRPPTISRPNPHPTSNIMAQNNAPRRQDIHEQVQLKQVLSGHGPIDLSSVLRPRSTHSHLYDSAPAPQDDSFYESFHYGTHNYHGNIEGGSEWRSSQGPSKTSSQYIGTPSEEDLTDYLKPSMSTSSSLASLSSLASSHSMSTIDSPIMDLRYRPGQAQAQELNAPHRMSALEIAQKYRQQQLKQGQHMLPTPPSSSSPLWSSRLSPYQGSLASPYSDLGLSPELAMSSNLPAIINYLNQTNLQHLQRQSETPLRTSLDDISRSGFTGQKVPFGSSPLSSTGNHYSDVVNLQDLRHSVYSPEIHQLDHVAKFLQTQSRGNALGFAPVSNITQQSPAQPRAPPNTPSTLITRTRAVKMEEQRRALSLTPIVHAPSSPQSPDLQPRTRSVSLQHPRSIPLTQLIQRRLSSVQEEDSGPPIDMSSPSGSPPQRSRSLSTGETPTSARKLGVSRLSNPPTTRHLDTVLPSMGSSHGPVQAQNYRQRSTRSDPIANDATKFTQPHSTTKGRTGGPHGRPTIVNTGRENPALTYGSNKDFGSRERGRGRGRGRRGGRGTSVPVRVNGPERVDGGMTVRC